MLKKTEKGSLYVVALTIPGNPFPVTEHPFQDENKKGFSVKDEFGERSIPNPKGYYGKGVRGGYQSHYAIVTKSEISSACLPIHEEAINPINHCDELVVFQDAQALPLFVLYVQHSQ